MEEAPEQEALEELDMEEVLVVITVMALVIIIMGLAIMDITVFMEEEVIRFIQVLQYPRDLKFQKNHEQLHVKIVNTQAFHSAKSLSAKNN